MCNFALIDIPEISRWSANPNTYFTFLIFVFIDKAVPHAVSTLIFWTVQFQISPILKDIERVTSESIKTGALLLIALLLSTINKNRTGLNLCNERVSR